MTTPDLPLNSIAGYGHELPHIPHRETRMLGLHLGLAVTILTTTWIHHHLHLTSEISILDVMNKVKTYTEARILTRVDSLRITSRR